MQFYSTRNKTDIVSSGQAIVNSLCPLGGLYMPDPLPTLIASEIAKYSDIAEIGYQVISPFFLDSFSKDELSNACRNAFNFAVPLLTLREDLRVLELIHGPSLAFKDFGARFLAELLSLIANKSGKEFEVLTATSGDTGGAVAAAMFNKPGIKVSILFPKGRISQFQKGQMTRWGENVRTIEVAGSFDDCQSMVKQAFLDPDIKSRPGIHLLSANSINIARLIAQTVYYVYALNLLDHRSGIKFVVPSGNLGNLTAGVFAANMLGSDCSFVSAHNANLTFPEYLKTAEYKARPSVQTVSNAMDVGAPSNFERLNQYFGSKPELFRAKIEGFVVSDEDTLEQIRKTKAEFNYLACPHTAVALNAAEKVSGLKVVLATAAPIKFADVLKLAGIELNDPELSAEVKPATEQIRAEFSELAGVLIK
jgi:threonine synthase